MLSIGNEMKIAIKNPAPEDISEKPWGDYHFGNCLLEALERRDVTVLQDMWPRWTEDHGEDVVLVLRGLRKFEPPSDKFSILWIISHPALVGREELNAYDLILTASAFHRGVLKDFTNTPVELARQCTDPGIFYPAQNPPSVDAVRREGIVYVANRRRRGREMAQWMATTGVDVRVFGRHWEKTDIGHLVQKDYVPKEKLANLYRCSRLGLNDHWHDMRSFGFINNRIFDSVACGLPVMTDSFPELRQVFGPSLIYAQDEKAFRDGLNFCEQNYVDLLEKVQETWKDISGSHTFDRRAAEIIEWIESPPVNMGRTTISIGGEEGTGKYSEILHECVAEKDGLMCELAAMEIERENLQGELSDVYNSVSWRATAPVRGLGKVIQRLVKDRL